MFEVIFDLETKKFFDEVEEFDPSKLGVSVVSLYARELDQNLKEIKGKIQSFWERSFGEMWEIFAKADRIVGFNSIGFDVPALFPYGPSHFPKLPHFDILQKIKEVEGKRVSLEAIVRGTLGSVKTDTGENAILYWQKGDKEGLEKLRKYCEADVLLTKDIYDFGLKNGILKYIDFWNNIHEVKVNFSYPKDNSPTRQTSLF